VRILELDAHYALKPLLTALNARNLDRIALDATA